MAKLLVFRCAAAACLVAFSVTGYAKADCRLIPLTEKPKVWIKKDLKELTPAENARVFERCDEMRLESGQIQMHYSSDRASDSAMIGGDSKDIGVPFGQLVQFAKDGDAFGKKMRQLLEGPPRESMGGRSFDNSKCLRLFPCGMIVQPQNDLHIPIDKNVLQSARLISQAGTESAGGLEITSSDLVIHKAALVPGGRYRLALTTPAGKLEQPFSVGEEQWTANIMAAIAGEEHKRGGHEVLTRMLARLQAMRSFDLQFESDLLARDIQRQYPFLTK